MTTKNSTQFGILFGFVGAFILMILCYGVVWRFYNKREEKKEAVRKADLIERGFDSSGEFEEKGKEREEYRHGGAGMVGTGAGSERLAKSGVFPAC
jgi:hypothetical protein